MSDTSENNEDNKGFHIDKKGFHCILCRCKRQIYHKETKTVKENDKVTTNTVVDKVNLKFLYATQDGVKHKSHQKS